MKVVKRLSQKVVGIVKEEKDNLTYYYAIRMRVNTNEDGLHYLEVTDILTDRFLSKSEVLENLSTRDFKRYDSSSFPTEQVILEKNYKKYTAIYGEVD